MRRMILSKNALICLSKIFCEAFVNKGKSFKSWRCRDISTYIYCTQKLNIYGRFISLIAVKGHSRSIIIIPKNKFNEEWGRLANKIELFINEKSSTIGVTITPRAQLNKPFIRNGNNKEAIAKSKWIQRIEEKESTQEENALLHRCLVERFTGGEEAPTRNDVRWACQTWKGTPNLQVV